MFPSSLPVRNQSTSWGQKLKKLFDWTKKQPNLTRIEIPVFKSEEFFNIKTENETMQALQILLLAMNLPLASPYPDQIKAEDTNWILDENNITNITNGFERYSEKWKSHHLKIKGILEKPKECLNAHILLYLCFHKEKGPALVCTLQGEAEKGLWLVFLN